MTEDLLTLARAKGTDRQFREWVRRQPSCITGHYSEWLTDIGEWRNPACHVRRASEFGTGFKADFACVAMTHKEHALQTEKGEAACLNRYDPEGRAWTNLEAKAFFDERRIEFLKAWISS